MRRKDLIIGILLSVAVMVAVPVGIFGLSSENFGMDLALGFLFVIGPAWSVVAGIYASRDAAHLWAIPVISGVLFVPGMWIATGTFNTSFLPYAAAYAGIGAAAMLLSRLAARPSEESEADVQDDRGAS